MAYILGKKILMLCFSWPPRFFGVGMYRGLHFARYLSKFGWEVTAIVSDSGEPKFFCPEEDGKIDGVRVIRVSYKDNLAPLRSKRVVKELLALPDENIAWYKPALKEIEKLSSFNIKGICEKRLTVWRITQQFLAQSVEILKRHVQEIRF